MIIDCWNCDIHCATVCSQVHWGTLKQMHRLYFPLHWTDKKLGTQKLNGAGNNLLCPFSSAPTLPYPCHSQIQRVASSLSYNNNEWHLNGIVTTQVPLHMLDQQNQSPVLPEVAQLPLQWLVSDIQLLLVDHSHAHIQQCGSQRAGCPEFSHWEEIQVIIIILLNVINWHYSSPNTTSHTMCQLCTRKI